MKRMTPIGVLALVLMLALAGCVPVPQPEQPAAAGANVEQVRALNVRNDASIGKNLAVTGDSTVGGNLNVAGTASITGGYTTGASTIYEGATANDFETTLAVTDPTADRTITLPNMSGYVQLATNPGKLVMGQNTITGTLSISHGITTPQAVFCDLAADAVANAATCSSTVSGSTVTIKVWKADGVTAASVPVLVDWLVGGQP